MGQEKVGCARHEFLTCEPFLCTGSVGVSMISGGIRANWSITALSLNYCSMQCVGASTLARCLSGNQ
eukprot:551730-Hanusia_phi.AAC.1